MEQVKQILLAQPRGFCAGVDRAIEIVERAIAQFGAPIYVRHEIVHNPIQSCGSICVVSGLWTRFIDSTKRREIAGQSASGIAARCALKLPTAPFHLPRMGTACQRASANPTRAATLANSLPRVVGLAVWPWVLESIGSAACVLAHSESFARTVANSSTNKARAERNKRA